MVPISAPDPSPLVQQVDALLASVLPAGGAEGLVVELDQPAVTCSVGDTELPATAEVAVHDREGHVRGRLTAHGGDPGQVPLDRLAGLVGSLLALEDLREAEQELATAVSLARDAEQQRERRADRVWRHVVDRLGEQLSVLRPALAATSAALEGEPVVTGGPGGSGGTGGNSEAMALLERAAAAARDIAGLLEDVRSVRGDALDLEPASHRLEDLVAEALAEMGPPGADPGDLRVVSSRDVVLMVDASSVRSALRHVLESLRRDADEQRDVSRIEVVAEVEGDTCVLAVEDDGGAEQVARLRRQLLAGPGGSDEDDGGIALAVVRSVVEAHGGRCWIDAGDRGAVVRLTLPVAVVDDLAARRRSGSQGGQGGQDGAASSDAPSTDTAESTSTAPSDNVLALFDREGPGRR